MKDLPDILRCICEVKRAEIAGLKRHEGTALRRLADRQPPPLGFRQALAGRETVSLIAEVKKASPSAGVIRLDFEPVTIARAYARGGAAAVSVLTDRRFFQGHPEFLERIRAAVSIPLLRKDFILDEVQVVEARALGADACLLIVAALEPEKLRDLMAAGRSLGMDSLVEVHDESELDTAAQAGADLIGINNRNLRTFDVALATAERLAPLAPEGAVVVAESGIKTRADIGRLKAAGVHAVLVGETLMRAPEIEAAVRALAGV